MLSVAAGKTPLRLVIPGEAYIFDLSPVALTMGRVLCGLFLSGHVCEGLSASEWVSK